MKFLPLLLAYIAHFYVVAQTKRTTLQLIWCEVLLTEKNFTIKCLDIYAG